MRSLNERIFLTSSLNVRQSRQKRHKLEKTRKEKENISTFFFNAHCSILDATRINLNLYDKIYLLNNVAKIIG